MAERTTSVLHEDKKEIVKRLSRALGHLRHVKQMVEEERDCPDVLIQLAAVNGALGGTGKEILAYCLDEYMQDILQNGDNGQLEAFKEMINRYVK